MRSRGSRSCSQRGEKVAQETRLWNLEQQKTVSMRSKEYAHDYRYFPEPDLLPLMVSEAWREEIRQTLPELPQDKRLRFTKDYGLSGYDAEVLTGSRVLADYYEKVTAAGADPKLAANWVMGDLLGALKAAGNQIGESPVSPDALAGLLALIQNKTLSGKMAKSVFEKMFSTSESAEAVVGRLGLRQITDSGQIRDTIRQVIAANPKQLAQYKSGKTALIGFFVGQVMKSTRGQANPRKVNELLKEELGGA